MDKYKKLDELQTKAQQLLRDGRTEDASKVLDEVRKLFHDLYDVKTASDDDFIEDGDKAEAVAEDVWSSARSTMMSKIAKIIVAEAKAIAKRHGVTPDHQYRDHKHGIKSIEFALAIYTGEALEEGKYGPHK